ncbi:putative transmembrane domain-containing protein [Cryptosporidium parvum]
MGIFGLKTYGSVLGPRGVTLKGLVVYLLVALALMGERVRNIHVFSFEDDEHEAGNQYVFDNLTNSNSEHELNSPFGIVPSNEHHTGIDAHVDNSDEHILQKSEHRSLSGLGEVGSSKKVFGEGATRREVGDEVESIYSEEDGGIYMDTEQDEEIGDIESFLSFDSEFEKNEMEEGIIGNAADKVNKVAVGLDTAREGQTEDKQEIVRSTEEVSKGKADIKVKKRTGEEAKKETEAKGDAEVGIEGKEHHHVAREAVQQKGEAKVMGEKKSQEKSKASGVSSLGRSKRKSEGESEDGEATTNSNSSEEKKKPESGVIEDSDTLSDKVKIKTENVHMKKHIKTIQTPGQEPKEGNQTQNTPYVSVSANDSANANNSVSANINGSISSVVPIMKAEADFYTKNTNETLNIGVESSGKVADVPSEATALGEGYVGSGKNITTEATRQGPSTNIKQKSLKKAASSSRDKSKRKSSRTDDSALKKVSRESNKGEGLESPKSARLGSSRGDNPKTTKHKKHKQYKDLKFNSKEIEDSEARFKDRYRCLNVNTNIFESLRVLDPSSNQTCLTNSEFDGLNVTRGLTEDDKEQRKESKQRLGPLKKMETEKKNCSFYSIWQEFTDQVNNMCTQLEHKVDSSSKKPLIADLQTSIANITSNLNNTATTSTTTVAFNITEITTENISGIREKKEINSSSTEEKPKILNLAGTERMVEVPQNYSNPIKSDGAKSERSKMNSKSKVSWTRILQKIRILNIPDIYIQATAKKILKFNIYIYRIYTDKYKRKIIKRVQGILRNLKIVNKSQMIKDRHFLGAYTIFGSLLTALLLLSIATFHGRQYAEKSEDILVEAETIKKLGFVGGKIKMISSHLSNSDTGIERVVFSDDPSSICQMILKSKSIVAQNPSNIDYTEEITDSKDLNSILNLTTRLEENNEILLHLSNGLAKCAQSLTI